MDFSSVKSKKSTGARSGECSDWGGGGGGVHCDMFKERTMNQKGGMC
jgi:hypothetical protein